MKLTVTIGEDDYIIQIEGGQVERINGHRPEFMYKLVLLNMVREFAKHLAIMEGKE